MKMDTKKLVMVVLCARNKRKHMKYLRIKYTFIFLLLLANCFAQENKVKEKETKELLEYVVDSLLTGDVVYPNSKNVNLIESKTGVIYDSITRQTILNALKEITTEKEALKIIAGASNKGLMARDMILNDKFLVVDSCPSSRLIYSLGKKVCPTTIFSTPMFFSKNKYCLLSYETFIQGGSTVILKKDNGEWTLFKRVCQSYY